MKTTITKTITTDSYFTAERVRDFCITYRYYTRGDCEAYGKMLAEVEDIDGHDVQAVYKIAKDIYDHSELKPDEVYTENDLVAGIMHGLYTECMITTVTVEG